MGIGNRRVGGFGRSHLGPKCGELGFQGGALRLAGKPLLLRLFEGFGVLLKLFGGVLELLEGCSRHCVVRGSACGENARPGAGFAPRE